MRNYIVGVFNGFGVERVLYQTASLKAAKKWATSNRYYDGRLTVPDICTRLPDGRVVLFAFGKYNRHTHRTKWTDLYRSSN